MAMNDYFINCTKMTVTRTSDGLNGYETTLTAGATVNGLPIRRRITETVVGAGHSNAIKYTFHTSDNVSKGDILRYTEDGVVRTIRITSDALTNTDLSGQTGWKSFEAVDYE